MPHPESKFQSAFTKWLRCKQKENEFLFSFAYELKVKHKGKRLNFKSDMQPQQIPKLLQAKKGCLHKKLSDLDPSLKPCDGLNVCGQGFLIIHWYEPRKTPVMYWLDIDKVIQFMATHKSISESEAEEIASYKEVIY